MRNGLNGLPVTSSLTCFAVIIVVNLSSYFAPFNPFRVAICLSTRRLSGQFEEVFHERKHRTIHPLDFWIRGFDYIVFVRRMRAAAMAKPEMAGRQAQRFASEHVPRP